MNINVLPVAAKAWADENFAGVCMRQRENGRLYAR